jgi:tyrosine-protein kinase
VGDVRLLVGPVDADAVSLQAAGQLTRSYADLASSGPVVVSAARVAGVSGSLGVLRGAVSASPNEVTRMVDVRVVWGDAGKAAAFANAVAARLIGLSSSSGQRVSSTVSDLLSQAEVSRLSAAARSQVQETASRLSSSLSAGQLQVVQPAVLDSSPVSPKVPLLAGLAALLGGLLAGLLLFVRELVAGPRADPQSLGEIESVPFLGVVDGGGRRGGLGDGSESYRILASKLQARGGARCVLVLGADQSANAAGVAANLAGVMADADWRVLLVDADTVTGSASRMLGVSGERGYSDLLSARAEHNGMLDSLRRTHRPGLEVLPKGTANIPGLIDIARLRRALPRFKDTSDIVIISAPSPDISPIGLAWANVAESTLLVANQNKTPTNTITNTIENLNQVNANLTGTILTKRG